MNRALLIFLIYFVVNITALTKKEILHQHKYPPCKACRVFVESFKRGMEKTKKGKFEGGDAAWEEEKMLSYAKSEVRLAEIQEDICKDVEEGKDQCYSLHEEYDSLVEEWWLKHQDTIKDIYEYLCINEAKKCCPDQHYGPNCLPCLGEPDNICSNNGKCKGSGTRKGNGKCLCDEGYQGEVCNKCANNYFEAYRDENKLICSKCHASCSDGCKKAGPKGCYKCAEGWLETLDEDKNKECKDINECAAPKPPCSPLHFCVNTEGSYKCLDCDRSCAGCTGDGPDMCIKCAKGYEFKDNMCIDSQNESRRQHVFITRYLTYLGLCVATCIIFQRSMLLAAIIGLLVSLYIAVSEYVLNSPPTVNTTNLADQIMHAQTHTHSSTY